MGYDNKKTYNSKLYASEWNTLVTDMMNWIEPDIQVPVTVRMVENSFVQHEDDYIICRSKILHQHWVNLSGNFFDVSNTDHEHSSFITQKLYGFGTYIWRGKVNETDKGEEYFGFERHHGYPHEGIATFIQLNGNYFCWNSNGSVGAGESSTTITGPIATQDWTSVKEFKIVWDAAFVKYYVDDDLICTNTTHVPQCNMGFFSEACTYKNGATEAAATVEARAYFEKSSLIVVSAT